MVDYSNAYLVGTLMLFPVWIALFLYRLDLRGEMLKISLIVGVLAPIWAPWFFNDYWNPVYSTPPLST